MMGEERFTPSRPWQQNPEHWHSTDADATEHEVTELVAAFVRALQPELAIETGTNSAQTALAIGRALKANGHGRLVTLEINHQMAEDARQLCGSLPVEVVIGKGADYLPDRPVGFAWLDSDAHARHLELEHYLPFLDHGAIVGVHDTAPHHPVHGYLEQLVYKHDLQMLRLHTPRGVSFLQAR